MLVSSIHSEYCWRLKRCVNEIFQIKITNLFITGKQSKLTEYLGSSPTEYLYNSYRSIRIGPTEYLDSSYRSIRIGPTEYLDISYRRSSSSSTEYLDSSHRSIRICPTEYLDNSYREAVALRNIWTAATGALE